MLSRRVPLMFRQDESRFTLFPIKHADVWEFYKKSEASFWTTEEIDLGLDRFEHLEENERTFIKKVLAFFSFADGIVVENLAENFCSEVQWPEARSFYGFQIAMENIHSETYSLLIDHFAKEDKQELFSALKSHPALRRKADWMIEWMRSDNSFAERLVAFACVEGIHFSAAFSCLFWCKKRGLPLNGLLFSNELISRDEGLHCSFACLLHNKMWEPGGVAPAVFEETLRHAAYEGVPPARASTLDFSDAESTRATLAAAYPTVDEATREAMALDARASMRCSEGVLLRIIRSACDVEFEFIRTEALPVRLIGMNADSAVQYVQFVANRLASELGATQAPYPGATNPYEWMDLISLSGKTNFFERRVSDYQKSGVMASLVGAQEKKFTVAEEF